MPKIDIDNYIEQSGMRKARFGGYEPDDVPIMSSTLQRRPPNCAPSGRRMTPCAVMPRPL